MATSKVPTMKSSSGTLRSPSSPPFTMTFASCTRRGAGGVPSAGRRSEDYPPIVPMAPHADVADVPAAAARLGRRSRSGRVPLDGDAMGRGWPQHERSRAIGGHAAEHRDAFHVHQVVGLEDAVAHEQHQLGAKPA